MANTIEADGLFSVSYTTTRLGNIATGFNMSMSGPSGTIANKKTVNVTTGTHSGVWGSDQGAVLSEGKRVSRNYEGESSVVVDPIYDLFQKIVYFTMVETSFSQQVSGAGNMVILNPVQAHKALYETLGTGDIQGFIESTVKPPGNITIKYDNVKNSPIVAALSGGGGLSGVISKNTVNLARTGMTKGKMMSVGDIFSKFISPLGLELYWVKDGTYSLEPPRLSMDSPKSLMTIKRDEIIDLRITTDPYNAPDVVIPTMTLHRTLGSLAGDNFTLNSLKAGVLSGIGSKNLKVSTYDIPDFLINPVKAALLSTKDFSIDNYEGGMPGQTTREAAVRIASFYGAHARKSSLYAQKSGECVMFLRPDITQAYSWYTIDGMLCFVSDIRHTITRSSAMTVLTIAGIDDPALKTGSASVTVPSETPTNEELVRQKLVEFAKNKTKEIKSKRSSGSKSPEVSSNKKSNEEMDKIFGNSEDNDNAIMGSAIESADSFVKG